MSTKNINKVYMGGCRFHQKSKFVTFHFKMVTKMTLRSMKRDNEFLRRVMNKGEFLDAQWLHTTDIVIVGGLLYSHPKYTNAREAGLYLNEAINRDEEVVMQVQVQ